MTAAAGPLDRPTTSRSSGLASLRGGKARGPRRLRRDDCWRAQEVRNEPNRTTGAEHDQPVLDGVRYLVVSFSAVLAPACCDHRPQDGRPTWDCPGLRFLGQGSANLRALVFTRRRTCGVPLVTACLSRLAEGVRFGPTTTLTPLAVLKIGQCRTHLTRPALLAPSRLVRQGIEPRFTGQRTGLTARHPSWRFVVM